MYVGDKQHFMSVCIFLLFPEGWNNEPCWEVIVPTYTEVFTYYTNQPETDSSNKSQYKYFFLCLRVYVTISRTFSSEHFLISLSCTLI